MQSSSSHTSTRSAATPFPIPLSLSLSIDFLINVNSDFRQGMRNSRKEKVWEKGWGGKTREGDSQSPFHHSGIIELERLQLLHIGIDPKKVRKKTHPPPHCHPVIVGNSAVSIACQSEKEARGGSYPGRDAPHARHSGKYGIWNDEEPDNEMGDVEMGNPDLCRTGIFFYRGAVVMVVVWIKRFRDKVETKGYSTMTCHTTFGSFNIFPSMAEETDGHTKFHTLAVCGVSVTKKEFDDILLRSLRIW